MTSLHPACEALRRCISPPSHPDFPSLVDALRPYVADLTLACGCVLPDSFEVGVLTWPSEAVHVWAWPGFVALGEDSKVNHGYYCYWGKLLSETTPTIDSIPVPNRPACSPHSCSDFAARLSSARKSVSSFSSRDFYLESLARAVLWLACGFAARLLPRAQSPASDIVWSHLRGSDCSDVRKIQFTLLEDTHTSGDT